MLIIQVQTSMMDCVFCLQVITLEWCHSKKQLVVKPVFLQLGIRAPSFQVRL